MADCLGPLKAEKWDSRTAARSVYWTAERWVGHWGSETVARRADSMADCSAGKKAETKVACWDATMAES